MLPAAPKTLGRLSDVFISALGSITGHSNRLGFSSASKAVVILVDGLGSENLRAAGGHAPYLNEALKTSKSINTVFPSTTAAAITSFGVGAKPSVHGILGYSVFDRSAGVVRNLLSGWGEGFEPNDFQLQPSVASLANRHNIKAYAVGPGEYASSGFTALNMAGAEYVAAKTFDERISATLNIVKNKNRSITYLYFPELDSTAHSSGVGSFEWLRKVEDLDASIRSLVASLPEQVGVILTADHGIVDVPRENQILLDELELPGLVAVTGDPRNCFLYFEAGSDIGRAKATLEQHVGDRCIVVRAHELQQAGWLGEIVANKQFLPDLFVISVGATACYHRGYAKPQSLKMIGQHGGISQTELSVPLLKFGVFAN
jgi:predicted AlkP superfamily pyrophosphatase or phosphodiesterase